MGAASGLITDLLRTNKLFDIASGFVWSYTMFKSIRSSVIGGQYLMTFLKSMKFDEILS